MILTKFDLMFISHKSIKGEALVDHFDEAPSSHIVITLIKFIDIDILSMDEDEVWKIYFDGS